jgi:hypothetical protein
VIFDTFCGLVERHLHAAIPLLQRAHLFEFPGDSHAVLPRAFDAETAEILSESFFLPFPTIAIEDPVSCVILFDTVDGQKGVGGVRRFAECMPLDHKHLSRAAKNDPRDLERLKSWPVGLSQIAFGTVESFHVSADNPPLLISGHVDRLILCNKQRVYATDISTPFSVEQANNSILTNVRTAFEELFYFNNPGRFVVERTDLTTRPQPPHLKIRRTSHRPRYILLTPDEIRERIKREDAPEGGRKLETGHDRRRHWRWLRSERYSEAVRAKPLLIPATWVGPSTGTFEKSRYRVRLDL